MKMLLTSNSKVFIKVMHIFTVNVMDLVSYRVQIKIAIKKLITYGLQIGIFIFDLDVF